MQTILTRSQVDNLYNVCNSDYNMITPQNLPPYTTFVNGILII